MLRVLPNRRQLVCALALLTLAVVTAVALHAQKRFEVFLLAVDEGGLAVTDLKAADLVYRESEKPGTVVSVEPYRWPAKVTVLVDNGTGGVAGVGGSGRSEDGLVFDNLTQYRAGLKKFFEMLPRDVEVTLIATAPNPRVIFRSTTDPVQIQKGINLITPETEFPGRFTDALTEYAERLDIEFKHLSREERPPYLPVLISMGSTGLDGSRIERDRVQKMMTSLRNYGVSTHFIMTTPTTRSLTIENEGGTVLIAKAVQELTAGKYYPIAGSASTRLMTLLPELAQQIQLRHLKQTLQYKLTIERPEGATGDLSKSEMSLSRPGVRYILSIDGSYP